MPPPPPVPIHLEIAFASPLPVTVWEITKDGTKRERKERKKERKENRDKGDGFMAIFLIGCILCMQLLCQNHTMLNINMLIKI